MNGLINGNLNLEPNKSVYQEIRMQIIREPGYQE